MVGDDGLQAEGTDHAASALLEFEGGGHGAFGHQEGLGEQGFADDDGLVAGHDKGRLERHFAQIAQGAELVELVHVGFVTSVHREQFEPAEVLPLMAARASDLETVRGRRVEEEVEVVAASEHVLLDGELLLDVHVAAEIAVISGDEVASAAFGAGVLDDDRPVDVLRVLHHTGHVAAALLQPLALKLAARFPVEDAAVSEGRGLQFSEVVRAEVLDQRAVRDDDDVALTHPFGVIHQLVVVVKHQPLVGIGAREGRVEAAPLFANGDAQGSEAFHAGAVEDLQRGV